MSWIKQPLALRGSTVSLLPLGEIHFEQLLALAAETRIWQHYTIDGSNSDTLRDALATAVEERECGMQYPFVIVLHAEDRIIGSTRFLDIQPMHKKLEIGWTWLHPDFWRTGINTECKFLLLSHCFEILHTRRVQLKTDENNTRSRKAIEKIGARFEGILRNDMVRENGTSRNSAYFSILHTEWTAVRENLREMMKRDIG